MASTSFVDPEYAAVGGLLLAPHQLDAVGCWLRPEDFARPACRELYEVLLGMSRSGAAIDPVTVLGQLRRDGRLNRGDFLVRELIRVVEAVPSPLSAPYYARQVLEGSIFRTIERAGDRIGRLGRNQRGVVEDALETVGELLHELAEQRIRWVTANTPDGADMPTAGLAVEEHDHHHRVAPPSLTVRQAAR